MGRTNLLRYLPLFLPVVSAAVFVLWYGIKQRGTYRNLAEDYAFKQATAMAFHGYRSQMGDDSEMLKLLHEVAIHNFGANPTRMLKKDEAGLPITETIDGKWLEQATKTLKEVKDLVASKGSKSPSTSAE